MKNFIGQHIFNIKESELHLIKNSHTDYKILYSHEASERVRFAAAELNRFMRLASGVNFKEETQQEEFSENAQVISLGRTMFSDTAEIKSEKKELGEAGFRIITKGKSVFIIGGGDLGTQYGVYEFLLHTIGWRIYSADLIVYNKNLSNLKLPSFNVVHVPDFKWRQANYGITAENHVNARRFRMNSWKGEWNELWIEPAKGKNVHNYFTFVPPDIYNNPQKSETYHPEWFSEGNKAGKQLCFSRDPDGLLAVVFKNLVIAIKANPHLSSISFTQQDSGGWCECIKCKESTEKYGTDSALMVQFANRLACKLSDYMNEYENGREMILGIFAYQNTIQAPVKSTQQNGVYEPADKSVILEKNIALFYAADIMDMWCDFDHPNNAEVKKNINKWAALTDKFYFWFYSFSAGSFFLPVNSFESMQHNYRIAKAVGADFIFDQSQYNLSACPDWGTLKNYLNSKLQWNCNLDYNALIDDFFVNYFGKASKTMREYFEDYRSYTKARELGPNDKKYIMWCWPTTGVGPWPGNDDQISGLMHKRFWDKQKLLKWLALAEEAKDAVSGDLVLQNRILLETLSPRYLLIQLYADDYTAPELQKIKHDFKYDTEILGINRINEANFIERLWRDWGMDLT